MVVVVVQTDAINSAVDTVVVGMVSSTATQKNKYGIVVGELQETLTLVVFGSLKMLANRGTRLYESKCKSCY